MYSALHHQGKDCTNWPGRGLQWRKASQDRDILYTITISKAGKPSSSPYYRSILFTGTYIPGLCQDIGEKLGTGIYVRLIRKGSGVFKIEDSTALKEIMDNPHNLEDHHPPGLSPAKYTKHLNCTQLNRI